MEPSSPAIRDAAPGAAAISLGDAKEVRRGWAAAGAFDCENVAQDLRWSPQQRVQNHSHHAGSMLVRPGT